MQVKVLNSENFEENINSQEKLFVIKFTSESCPACGTFSPVYNALAEKNTDINFFEINSSNSPELASHFDIRGVPTTVYCENREVVYSFTGVRPLADFQYVIDNIDDSYFREHGDFALPEGKREYGLIIGVIAAILFLIIMALLN